jgi:hypothetical protein
LCGERVRLRLPEVYREYQADTTDSDAEAQLSLYQREMEQLLLPRYAALAEQQNQLERRSGSRRAGGDIYNRLSYAAIFFLIGLLVIWAPFIPLWDKSIPFLLALVAPLCSPWLPDLYQLLLQRRHRLVLSVLQADLDQAGRSLPLPPAALPPSSQQLPATATTAAAKALAQKQ